MDKNITKELLEDLYINKQMGCLLISRELNCSKGNVQYWLKKFNIKTRPHHGGKALQLKNKRFKSLLVLERDEDYAKKKGLKSTDAFWKCKCDCGEITYRSSYDLTKGKAVSCGCKHKKCGKNHFLWKGYGEISKNYFNRVERGAKDRGLEFKITLEEIWNLFLTQKRKCALSGLEIGFAKSHKEKSTASLDRIDSQKGYNIDNIQWVHKDINMLKCNITQDRLVELCNLVSKYLNC